MDEQTVRAHLARLEQLAVERKTLVAATLAAQQEFEQLQHAKQELDTVAQEWFAQLAEEKKSAASQTRDTLLRRQAALQAQLEQWETGDAAEAPMDAAPWLAQSEHIAARRAVLKQIETQLVQVEELAGRAREVAAQRALIKQVEDTRAAFEQTQRAAPAVLTAYQNLLALKDELKARQALRDQIVETIKALDKNLPDIAQGDWVALVLADSDDFPSQYGARRGSLKGAQGQAQTDADQLATRQAARTLELLPLRAKLQTMETQQRAHDDSFKNEGQEITLWSEQLSRLGISIPSPNMDALQNWQLELSAKFQALNEFDQTEVEGQARSTAPKE